MDEIAAATVKKMKGKEKVSDDEPPAKRAKTSVVSSPPQRPTLPSLPPPRPRSEDDIDYLGYDASDEEEIKDEEEFELYGIQDITEDMRRHLIIMQRGFRAMQWEQQWKPPAGA